MNEDEEVAVDITVFEQRLLSPIDVAAACIWIDAGLLEKIGGRVSFIQRKACAADEWGIHVTDEDFLDLHASRVFFPRAECVM